MKVAVHQPMFFPWAGFWAKAIQAEVLILMAGVDRSKGDLLNRVKIEDQWLTLPVSAPSIKIVDQMASPRDLRKVIKTIEQRLMSRTNSGRTVVGSILQRLQDYVYSEKDFRIADLNECAIRAVADILCPDLRVVLDNSPVYGESKTERLESVIDRNCKCDLYLSGQGGREYLQDMRYTVQYIGGVWPDCSILQLIATQKDPLGFIKGGLKNHEL